MSNQLEGQLPDLILKQLDEVFRASGNNPTLTFIILLTAAKVSGKLIKQSDSDIISKLQEVDGPANTIVKAIEGLPRASSKSS